MATLHTNMKHCIRAHSDKSVLDQWKCGAIKIRYNIRRIKPYKYDENVEDINPEKCV